MTETTKKCITCGEIKELSEFPRRKDSSDGHRNDCNLCRKIYVDGLMTCKECVKRYNREYRMTHRSQMDKRLKPTPTEKSCTICGVVKTINEFNTRLAHNNKRYYNSQCKKCDVLNASEYYRNNKNKKKEYDKQYIKRNSAKRKEQAQKWYKSNKDSVMARSKCRYNAKKSEIFAQMKMRYKNDIQYKLALNLRRRIYSALKESWKTGSAVKNLGCSIEELKIHLESKFYVNIKTGEIMTWDNYGRYGWHIDHIKPLSSFDLTEQSQFNEACNYTNLQPLWAEDNLSKGDKIIEVAVQVSTAILDKGESNE